MSVPGLIVRCRSAASAVTVRLCVVDVIKTGRRGVRAKGQLVARHGRGHAKPGIRVDVVGADQALGQLVEDVVVLGEELAGDVERHRVRAVLLNDFGEFVRRVAEGRRLRGAFTGLVFGQADLRVEHPVGARGTEVERRALGAEVPEVGRVVRVAPGAGNFCVFGLD